MISLDSIHIGTILYQEPGYFQVACLTRPHQGSGPIPSPYGIDIGTLVYQTSDYFQLAFQASLHQGSTA
jgi:hypothetical protein